MSSNTLSRILFNLMFLLVGIASYTVGLLRPDQPIESRILLDFGTIICSASIVFFIFSWITERHQIEITEGTVGKYLANAVLEIFRPVGVRTMATIWSDYRWSCWLQRSLGDGDPYDRYIVQNCLCQANVTDLPATMRFVIGYSNDNDAGKRWNEDPQCFLCWEMSWLQAQPLDLEDPRSHGMGEVRINGETIPLTRRLDNGLMPGGTACVYEYEVPARFIGQRANLSFAYFVRKISSMDGAINVIVRMRKDCDDADFQLTIDSSLRCAAIYVYTTETSPLVEHIGFDEARESWGGRGAAFGMARFRKIIQKGSNVRFEVRTR